MCNHYRGLRRKGVQIPGWDNEEFSELRIPLKFDNLPADVYPDRDGLVIRLDDGAPIIDAMRWGFPPPPKASAAYVTNVRNVASSWWKPWLKVEHRCVVPASEFSEYGQETPKRERWFARPDGEPMFFAGIWRTWEGDRGPKSKPVSGPHQIFSFLTCPPNGVVAPIHPKAMPVILRGDEIKTWLTAPTGIALQLQRPLPDDELVVVDNA